MGVPKLETKTFFSEYFPKNPSEMNSPHPFYTIFIPITPHAKIFIFFVGGPGGPRTLKKILWYLKINSTRGGEKIFSI